MPGGLGAGLGGSKTTVYGLPTLSRTTSMHPGDMEEFEVSLEADLASNTTSGVPSPHEPLALDWPLSAPPTEVADALSTLPALPPLETAPLGGPLTRAFNTILQDDAKFLRPVSKTTTTRHITPTPIAPVAASKKRRADAALAVEYAPSTSNPAPTPTHVPPVAPRKKRRGMRPNTYLCLFKGELFECPHGCDIVDKTLLYDLLRRN